MLSLRREYGALPSSDGPFQFDDRLLFLHFEKTAGTTIKNCLIKLFTPEEICPEHTRAIRSWPVSRLSCYRFFNCHAALADFHNVPEPRKVVSFLRDPLERLVSLYHYWQTYNDSGDLALLGPMHAWDNPPEIFFSEKYFLENLPDLINNYAQYLVGSPFFAPEGTPWRSEQQIIDCAIAQIDALSFVGITEELDFSFATMSERLDVPNYYTGNRENITRQNHLIDAAKFKKLSPTNLSKSTIEEIETKLINIDKILYKYATRRLLKRETIVRAIDCIAGPTTVCSVRVGRHYSWVAPRRSGFVIYGPYTWLVPGSYLVVFILQPRRGADINSPTDKLGVIDVIHNSKHVLARAELSPRDLEVGRVALAFDLAAIAYEVEFRVFAEESAPFEVRLTVDVTKKFT